MPNPIDRPSLTTDLLTRYGNASKVGGSHNAKAIPTTVGERSSNGGESFGIQEAQFTLRLFRVKSGDLLLQSDFKREGRDLSQYVKGLSTVPYDHRAK